MEYVFTIRKNIHMYCHLLVVSDGKKNYEAIVEDAATKDDTIIIWLEAFGFPEDEVNSVKDAMIKWFASQNIACIFEGRVR